MLYILLLIVLFGVQLAYFQVAERFNIIDEPNKRSSHKLHTLRGGGIIFYISALISFVISKYQFPWFFAGLTIIAFISFADDIKQQSPKLRMLVQFAGLVLLFIQCAFFSLPWYMILIALIISVGILNAFNFMDGINGITGAYSSAVMVALWYINRNLHFVDNGLIYIVLISLIVFNFFNFRKKAKCFAGDVGAVSMAFIILFLLGLLINKTKDFSYIVILAVYGVDTVLTIIHRLLLKENIFEPHRKHLFQLLANELKIPHLLVSTLYAVLQLLIAFGLLYVTHYRYIYLIAAVIVLSILYVVVKSKIYHLHKEETEKKPDN